MKFEATLPDTKPKQITVNISITGTIGEFLNMFTEIGNYGSTYEVEQLMDSIKEAI